MKRILLAFGDSHTAGAEINEQYSSKCHDRAYPAYIANHYGFEYENLAACGGSNDWLIRQFMIRIQKALIKKESVFVLCNFCDPSRTYIKLSDKFQHCTSTLLLQNENTDERLLIDPEFISHYENYLKTNSDNFLNFKSLSQILIVQSICEQYNIPYAFHVSTHWYEGNWNLINKKNFFGHHDTEKLIYNNSKSYRMYSSYSYWGVATHHYNWKNVQNERRWSNHYPEEYHKFWAELLIKFIDEQGILDMAL
jgi:hypothetical protein